MKKFFEKIKADTAMFFVFFYAKNKKTLTKLWIALAVVMFVGVASGAANSERFLSGLYLFKSFGAGVRFFDNFFLHIAYFALVYLAVINLYCSAAGFITVFFAAFKLGSGMAAMTAVYGFGGFVNAILIHLPVNLILIAALSAYLLVCVGHSGGRKNHGAGMIKPCYHLAAKESLFFLIPVLVVDIAAFLIVL
ncbi:MAG: hypothetical protein LBP62_08095 [Clostridiales bacterium]|nr:hypothetical protein [Clostridiales bacterium]